MILPDFKDFPHVGRLLGIDWGARRVGLAVSDQTQEFVFTRPQIDILKSGVKITDKIQAFVTDENLVGIVIGLPLYGDGSESETTKSVRLFAEQIAKQTDVPILLVDEYLTSVEAQDQLAGMRHGDLKKKLDSESAKVILENAIALVRRQAE